MGSDIFSRKCGAHNIIVPQHRSCPVCVSAKRSQLHAANLAHIPRYLFEQTLDVQADATGAPKPVRSFMKAPASRSMHIQGAASDAMAIAASRIPCKVRYKVNFKSNYLHGSYVQLASTTQALLMALDVATDAKLLKLRLSYQANITSGPYSLNDQDRLVNNLATDMWYEIVRATGTDKDRVQIDGAISVMGQFVAHFRLLYDSGQRLIRNEPASTPAKYVLNFTSLNGSSNLNSTTQELLRKLDKYEGDVGKHRIYHEKLIADTKSATFKQLAVKTMAEDLWTTLPIDARTRDLMKIRDQFLAAVEHLYFEGQRLVEVQVPVPVTVPAVKSVRLPTYKLTLKSRNWHGHYELLQETQEAFRVLESGIPEVYQRWFNLFDGVAKRHITVDSMAYTMWDTVVKQHEVRELKGDMTVRQDFVARFKYLYGAGGGQRLVIEETPTETTRTQLPSVDDDLVGCLYNYLMTSSKELYHKHALLESELGMLTLATREGLLGRFRNLACATTDAYAKDCMYDWKRMNTHTLRMLQERLTDAYLAGTRR